MFANLKVGTKLYVLIGLFIVGFSIYAGVAFYSLTRVEVGHRGADTVEVLSGLGVGDRLVLYPGARITDGARVRGLEHGAPGTPP